MTDERKSLCKVETDDGDYYLLTTLHDEGNGGFDLTLCDGERAWTGTVLDGDLEIMCKKVKMGFDELLSQTRKAVTKENVGSFNFIYQVKESGNILQFTWKKLLASDNIKFQLGSAKLKLKNDTTAVVRLIFNQAINSTEGFNKTISSLQSENKRLESERKSALQKVEKCVKAKEELEQDLYEKFVTVLNDKKAKIRDLRDEIEELRSGAPSTSVSSVKPETQIKTMDSDDEDSTSVKKRVKKEVDSDDDADTDDEKKHKQSPPKRVKVKEADDSQDSSLILGDGATEDDSPVAARRRRRGNQGKKTPAKAIIPKVPSSDGKSRASRSGSMRKSSSQLSKSSDDLDPDNLLDEFMMQE